MYGPSNGPFRRVGEGTPPGGWPSLTPMSENIYCEKWGFIRTDECGTETGDSPGRPLGVHNLTVSVVGWLVTVCHRHSIDCLLAIGLALVVAAVTEQSPTFWLESSDGSSSRPCACVSAQEYPSSKWIRSTLKLAHS